MASPAGFYAMIGKPHLAATSAPPPLNFVPPAAASTMFFRVFSTLKTTTIIGASGSANVIYLEDEDKEEAA